MDLKWMQRAACKDLHPSQFFPSDSGRGALRQEREALKICETCPVRTECLAYATSNRERFGVWGGRSFEPKRKKCGTISGHRQHVRNDEPSCFLCEAARSEYDHNRYLRRRARKVAA
jgi:WhiB family redox-sensing transcriptional regulator